MSKFEDICNAYTNSRKEFRDYEETCRNFARDLVYGPQDQEITYIPLGEEISPNDRFYALAGAMRMDNQAFWHFGVELTVEESGGSNPMPFLMSFFIKKIEPHFIVKLGPAGREIKIHEARQNELNPFYDAVYKQIVEFFVKDYFDAITKQQKSIKFITLSPIKET
jgi:hypothetical protein